MPVQGHRQRPRTALSSGQRSSHLHGWIPDLPDHRDLHYEAPRKLLRALPARVDLRSGCPPVYQQGGLHSCTANAIGAAIQFDKLKQGHPETMRPSRLFIYYNERAMERSIGSDSGAQIRNGIKTVARHGVCHEGVWPYKQGRFRQKPAKRCYKEAKKHPAVEYRRVRRALPELKACLASGYPFIFGFTVYQSFHSKEVARSGCARMPIKHEKIRGGHAVAAVGYDEKQHRFIVRNSWGSKWGMKGYFTMPYDYLMNHYLSQDFWMIRLVK
jgi:C1A family cysteine protease